MATNNTTSTLNGNFKRIYAGKLENLVPENAKLVRMTKMDTSKRLGDTYEQPVVLANEHGVTYATAGSGAFALNTPIAMSVQNARVPSNQMLIRGRIDYESASKASAGGDRAFIRTTELVVKNLLDSMTHRLETQMLYGGVGIGKTTASTNASTTSTVVTITNATWGVGLFAGVENAIVNFYSDSGSPIGGATYDHADSKFTVTALDVENKAITVTGSETGITALDAYLAATTETADIYHYGSYGNEMNGMDKILTNTGSLFGINATTYQLWKANTYSIGGAMTVSALLKATTGAIGKGGLNEDVNCYVAPQVWAVINSELAAKQAFDYNYKKTDVKYGFDKDAINLHCQSGMMKIYSHSMVKAGEGFIIPPSCLKRIGSTDITFNNPGTDDKFFRELTDNAGYELRAYCDQATFIDAPAKCTKLTGITY